MRICSRDDFRRVNAPTSHGVHPSGHVADTERCSALPGTNAAALLLSGLVATLGNIVIALAHWMVTATHAPGALVSDPLHADMVKLASAIRMKMLGIMRVATVERDARLLSVLRELAIPLDVEVVTLQLPAA